MGEELQPGIILRSGDTCDPPALVGCRGLVPALCCHGVGVEVMDGSWSRKEATGKSLGLGVYADGLTLLSQIVIN